MAKDLNPPQGTTWDRAQIVERRGLDCPTVKQVLRMLLLLGILMVLPHIEASNHQVSVVSRFSTDLLGTRIERPMGGPVE